jgi:hypothetical protein
MAASNPRFDNVFWIGGSSCSGKSSAAKRIAERFRLNVYHTDEHAFGKHMFALENEAAFPAISRYKGMIMEGIEAFAQREADVSYRAFLEYCAEVFPLLCADIGGMPKDRQVVVEGAHLLPELVRPHAAPGKAVFLIGAPDFMKRIRLREMAGEIPGGNPHEIENYRKSNKKDLIGEKHARLHQAIAFHIKETAVQYAFPVIVCDGGLGEEELAEKITRYFNLQ